MSEQIKRGLTIHSPTIMAGPVIDIAVDDIMRQIERECSMSIYETDEAATADLWKNLGEKLESELYFPRLVFNVMQALFNDWASIESRLSNVIKAANTYCAWLAIQGKVEEFTADAGRNEQ